MSLPQGTPERGPDAPHEHFFNLPLKGGETATGYVAGPAMWFWCHASKRSKPCLHILTERAVVCARCGGDKPVSLLGYQPWYRQSDGKARLCVLHEEMYDVANALEFHQRVTFGREKGDETASIWVAPALVQTPIYVTTLAHRNRPVDLTENLLRIWELPELTEWYRSQQNATERQESRNPNGGATRLRGKELTEALVKESKKVFVVKGQQTAPQIDESDPAVKMLRAVQAGKQVEYAEPDTLGQLVQDANDNNQRKKRTR